MISGTHLSSARGLWNSQSLWMIKAFDRTDPRPVNLTAVCPQNLNRFLMHHSLWNTAYSKGGHFPDKQAEKDWRLAFNHGKPAGAVWKTVGFLFALCQLQVDWGELFPSAIYFSSNLFLFSLQLQSMQKNDFFFLLSIIKEWRKKLSHDNCGFLSHEQILF